ncbi:hemerythrin domain-containing protein [Cuniculiplasma sp. SKW4]|uniref:hemerythrin domain-containing protein n=1 Tax=Cuniculiplasma sp. SKW4 TaxID=3400171 RepID=UPI003FD5745B
MKIRKDFEDDHIIEQMKMREIIEQIEKGELDLDLLDEIENHLKNHMFQEEEYIFPAMSKMQNLRLEIAGFQTEHAALWRLFSMIHADIDKGKFDKIEKYANEIYKILREHNSREEMFIYKLMNDNSIEGMSEERPEGWVCKKMREKITS